MADNDNEASAQQRWQELCTGLEEDPATYIREPQDGDVEPPTLAEVLLTMIDWYATHKQTYRACTDVYRILEIMAPPGTSLGTFQQARRVLDTHKLETLEVYDACPTGCVVYKDFGGSLSAHKFAALDRCPVQSCGSQRYVGLGADRRPAHKVYFFPIRHFLAALFAPPDLSAYLNHLPDERTPSGSIKRSRGYKEKATPS